jgi:IS6 family transposase
MTERGLSVDHSTVARQVLHFGPILNQRIRRQMRQPNRSSRPYVRGAGRWMGVVVHALRLPTPAVPATL